MTVAPGSVILQVTLVADNSTAFSTMTASMDALASNPTTVFTSDYTSAYNVTGVSASVPSMPPLPPPPPSPFPPSPQPPPTAHNALAQVALDLNSPSFLSSWNAGNGDPCTNAWAYVTCTNGVVTGINLASRAITANLPASLRSVGVISHRGDIYGDLLNLSVEPLPP